MSRNSAVDYFNHFRDCGADNSDYTYADVASHFDVAPATVRTALTNYLAKNKLARDFSWMLDRKPGTVSSPRVAAPIPDDVAAAAVTAGKLGDLISAFPGVSKSVLKRAYQAYRTDPVRGRKGRLAYQMWRAAMDAGEVVDWSAINKAIGERSPSFTSRLVANHAKRLGVDGPSVSAPRVNFKATDEQKAMLGTQPDETLAKLWGITTSAVASLRRRLDIPAMARESTPPDYSGEDGRRAYEAVLEHKTFTQAALMGDLGMSVLQVREAARGYAEAHGLPTDDLGAKTGRRKS